MSLNSFDTRKTLNVGERAFTYYSLPQAQAAGLGDVERLPMSLKILLENLLRFEDGSTVGAQDISTLAGWADNPAAAEEIAFRPARVLMQDFTGVPGVADLAAMRSVVVAAGYDPAIINPLSPVDLVIDHSVMVDRFGTEEAFDQNVALEMARNSERYRFLRWGQQAFDNFRVVPPGTGICHQVNLEYLARAVWTSEQDGELIAYPDTLVGTDSHTTMINGLGVLGWGVGGIEAEAAMLGQPISMLIPEVVGFKLSGVLSDGITATDLVLTVVEMLRRQGVVGKFVEFYGDGLDQLPLADRAGGPGGGLRQSSGIVAGQQSRRGGLLRHPGPGSGKRGAQPGWSEKAPGPGGHERYEAGRRRSAGTVRPRRQQGTAGTGAWDRLRSRARRRGAGGHHLLYQHLQSGGDARSRSGRQEGAGSGAHRAALGEDLPGTGVQGGHRISAQDRAAERSGCPGIQPGGLRLHYLHRQLRAAAGTGVGGDRRG
jgi:hypothetical protein